MKRRLLFPLMICALLLAGCYRQAEEEFQQVNSSEVEQATLPVPQVTSIVISDESGVTAPDSGGEESADDGGTPPTATSRFITPEPPPGQVEQPTVIVPTRVIVIAATPQGDATRRFTLPTSTLSFEEALNPNDECVYTVVPGDTLYRLAIAFGTTVEAFFEVNDLDSDALHIGQLLLVPDCESSEPEAPAAATNVPVTAEPIVLTAVEEAATATETSAVPTPLLPTGPRIHVVSAGETLQSIALRYEMSVDDIVVANDLAATERLSMGQELVIPDEVSEDTSDG